MLDAGTGVRRVTSLLHGKPFAGTILLTHLHWDHVQGLPFFRGGDRDDACVRLLLPEQHDGHNAEETLAKGMSPPQFPISPSGLRGRWTFGVAMPGRLEIDGFAVEIREVPHKGGRTMGYRVSDGRSAVAYIPDHCPTLLGPGPDGWGEYHDAAQQLASGADLLLHDAHLLAGELAAEAYFGSCGVPTTVVGLAERAGARRVVLFHHKPERTDEPLDELAQSFEAAAVPVTVGAEGMVFDL